MFTFGYKNSFSSILRALAAIGIGLVMIFGSNAMETVVKVIAAFVLAAGIVSLVYGIVRNRREGVLPLMIVNSVVDIAIGLLLFFNPQWVADFIIFIIGIVLILFGALQLMALVGVMSLLGAGFTSLLLSICAILGGAFLVFNPFGKAVMGIAAGVLLVVYGVSELISIWRLRKAREAYEASFAAQAEPESEPDKIDTSGLDDAIDAEFSKVEDN